MVGLQQLSFSEDVKQRLDQYLFNAFKDRGLSRSYWSNMIHAGYVRVNDEKVKSGLILRGGEQVSINWPEVTDLYSDRVKIIYEDESILAIDKPAGMLSHSKGEFNPEFTVADYVSKHIKGKGEDAPDREGIVHRLDRHTSGVMVAAKTKSAQFSLQQQFSERTTLKIYLAIVEGEVRKPTAIIDIPLARDSKRPKTFRPDKSGKNAITSFYTIKSKPPGTSLVMLMPETGRTHQLRAHMSHLGHPIVGDTEYGAKKLNESKRFLLHAHMLWLRNPSSNEIQQFVAPLPIDMSSYIDDSDKAAIIEQAKSCFAQKFNN